MMAREGTVALDAVTGLDSVGATTKGAARVTTAATRSTTAPARDTMPAGNRAARVAAAAGRTTPAASRATRVLAVRDRTAMVILGKTRTAILGKIPGVAATTRAGKTPVILSSARLVSRAWAAE